MPAKGTVLTAEEKQSRHATAEERKALIASGELEPKKVTKQIGDMTFIVADEKETEFLKSPKLIQLVRESLKTPSDKMVRIHLNQQTLDVFKDDKIKSIDIYVDGYLFEFRKHNK